MTMNHPKRVLMRWFLFACVGLLIEVFFIGIASLVGGNISAMSKTSPWMMIDYGLLGVVIWPIKQGLERAGVPLAGRAFVYMVGIFVIEYISGILFNMVGIRIWDYSHHTLTIGQTTIPMHVHGQVTLYWAPFWYALGFVLEWLHRRVDAVAMLLLTGRAEFESVD